MQHSMRVNPQIQCSKPRRKQPIDLKLTKNYDNMRAKTSKLSGKRM
jgi:hypothetical protein